MRETRPSGSVGGEAAVRHEQRYPGTKVETPDTDKCRSTAPCPPPYPDNHSSLHTDIYCETVNQMLLGATKREEAEAVLDAIRQSLLSGGL